MKKNKHKKQAVRTPSGIQKNILTIVASCILFVSTMYGFNCFLTKVCGVTSINKLVRSEYTLLMPKGALEVEVANTKASRELGLSGRTSMKDDEGLLFIFATPGRYGFWMKDMNFPLDLVWINDNGIVVSIERGITPDTYPKAFINQSEARYVLEINSGMAEKFGLYLGSKVKITD